MKKKTSEEWTETLRQTRINDLKALGHEDPEQVIGNHPVCQSCPDRDGDCVMVAICPLVEADDHGLADDLYYADCMC